MIYIFIPILAIIACLVMYYIIAIFFHLIEHRQFLTPVKAIQKLRKALKEL